MGLPSNQEELKLRIARELSGRLLPSTWRRLENEDYVSDYLERQDEQQLKIVIDRARELNRGQPGRKRGQKTRRVHEVIAHPLERERARLVSLHLAREASRHEKLLSLRQRFFGGRTLTEDEADRLIRQLGPQYFGIEWFDQYGLPLLGHSSFYHGPEFGTDTPVLPEDQMIRFRWGDQCRDEPGYADWEDAVARHGVMLVKPSGFSMMVWPSSVLGEVQQLASELSRLHGWHEKDATSFVLTGSIPPIFAIAGGLVGGRNHFAFRLRIEPWVTPESVKTACMQLQRTSLEKQPRLMDEKQLALFDFVESYLHERFGKSWEQMRDERLDFSWKDVAQLWKKRHGRKRGWVYTPERMRAAYKDVRGRIVGAIRWPKTDFLRETE